MEELPFPLLHGGQGMQQLDLRPEESLSNTSSKTELLGSTWQQRLTRRQRRRLEVEHAQSRRGRGRPKREPKVKVEDEVKDEAFLRRQMHVPHAEEYPDISPALFQDPKSFMVPLFGSALKTNIYLKAGGAAFQCVLKCTVDQKIEVCVGEGTRKVLYFDRQFLIKS